MKIKLGGKVKTVLGKCGTRKLHNIENHVVTKHFIPDSCMLAYVYLSGFFSSTIYLWTGSFYHACALIIHL